MGPVPMAAFEQSAASMLAGPARKTPWNAHKLLISWKFNSKTPPPGVSRTAGCAGEGFEVSGSWPGLVDADGGGFGPGAEAFRTDGADVEAEEVADGPVFQAWEISPEASAFAPKFTSET